MARKRRTREESFTRNKRTSRRYERTTRRSKADLRTRAGETWKSLNEGWKGTVLYIVLGVALALATKQTLAIGLHTDMPVVAVVSPSMQHDNVEATHYEWLAEHHDYNRNYIDSWSVPTGFLIGDMPIVSGEQNYEVGDVIVYSVRGQKFPIIHRVIKVNDDGTYQTKGDNNTDQLPYELSVSEGQIFGKVAFVIPKLGYFKVILTKILGSA
jgi:signal peptidase I